MSDPHPGAFRPLWGQRQRAFAELRDALAASDRPAFGRAVGRALGIDDQNVAEAIADVQFFAIGGLVREAIRGDRVRAILRATAGMKRKLLRERFTLPSILPFLMRAMLAANALLAALDAPESGSLGRLPGHL